MSLPKCDNCGKDLKPAGRNSRRDDLLSCMALPEMRVGALQTLPLTRVGSAVPKVWKQPF